VVVSKSFLLLIRILISLQAQHRKMGANPKLASVWGPQGGTTPPLWFPDLVQVNLQETPKSGQKRSTKHMTLSVFLDRFATHELRDPHDVVIRAFS
jgi:hypothetical protein